MDNDRGIPNAILMYSQFQHTPIVLSRTIVLDLFLAKHRLQKLMKHIFRVILFMTGENYLIYFGKKDNIFGKNGRFLSRGNYRFSAVKMAKKKSLNNLTIVHTDVRIAALFQKKMFRVI